MAGLKVPCLVAMYILACNAQNAEPEPDGYTTSMEPEPDTTMAPTDTTMAGNTTVTLPLKKHTYGISLTVPNFDNVDSLAALTENLTAGVQQAASAGATVKVTVTAIRVKSKMGGFPDPPTPLPYDTIIETIAGMSSALTKSDVLVTGADGVTHNHSDFGGGGRRLQNNQEVGIETIVRPPPAGSSTDIVALAKSVGADVHGDTAAIQTNLRNSGDAALASISVTQVEAPAMTVDVQTEITGRVTAVDANAIKAGVQAKVPGSVAAVTVTSTDEDVVLTTAAPEDYESDNGASLASMMIGWAFVYAFLMK